jgi:hypothetical protein
MSLNHITPAVMNDAARRLGAPDYQSFLAVASRSTRCAFRLICELIARHEPSGAAPRP